MNDRQRIFKPFKICKFNIAIFRDSVYLTLIT